MELIYRTFAAQTAGEMSLVSPRRLRAALPAFKDKLNEAMWAKTGRLRRGHRHAACSASTVWPAVSGNGMPLSDWSATQVLRVCVLRPTVTPAAKNSRSIEAPGQAARHFLLPTVLVAAAGFWEERDSGAVIHC